MWRPRTLHAAALVVLAAAHLAWALPHNGKKWALLVAGSKDYYNYRHQADVCHAYQILKNNGIPEENIIVMMFDDVANSLDNPTKGVIINEPGGSNVYSNVKIDYREKTVTSATFLAVLRGDKDAVNGTGSGRVLETGPHDHIFVNFVDHGAPGLLAMPSDILYASQLLNTLQEMVAQNRFAKLVFYVEACESGSMFDALLPDDMNIFVVTAADPHESSYACYFDNVRNTYLGDVFSVMWMQDTEQEDLSRETLHHQFEIVRSRTNSSHVEEYGDLNVGAAFLRDFIGSTPVASYRNSNRASIRDAISSRDVPIEMMKRKMKSELNATKKLTLRKELHRMHKHRKMMSAQFRQIIESVVKSKEKIETIMGTKKRLRNLKCYEKLVQAYDRYCFNVAQNPHAMSQLHVFVNACEMRINAEELIHAIKINCKSNSLPGFFTDAVV